MHVAEYSYDKAQGHLTDREALEYYKKTREAFKDALITLNDLDCGHWSVDVYQSDDEKDALYRQKASEMYRNFLSTFIKHGIFRNRR